MRQLFTFTAAALLLAATSARASFLGPDAAAHADHNATLNRLEGAYAKTLNPMLWSLAVENDIINDFTVFETLVTTDPDTGEAVCMLCTEFTYDPADKRVVTFKLRPDVRFHDGVPMTAQDVKFSFDVMVNPKVDNLNLKSDVIAAVDKVEAVDDHTVKITFKKVKYANIYQVGVAVIPKHLFPYFDKNPEQFNKDQKFGRSPVGTGPYKFEKWDGDKYIELVRNDDWWGFKSKDPRFKNSFNFKKVRFKFITNENVAEQAFKKGEFDFMDMPSYMFDEVSKAKDDSKIVPLHLVPKISTSFMFLGWNARLPKFADAKTREALELLTDRKSTLAKFSKGLRPPTNGPWGINSPYECPKEKCPVAPFDPPKAKQLLTEAGWKDSEGDGCLHRVVGTDKQTLKFTILSDDQDWSKNVLGVYVTEMKKAGVCAEVRALDWTAMAKLVDDLNFEAYLSGWALGFPILPRQQFHSENIGKTGSNTVGFVDKDVDKLIDQFESEFDEAKRIKIGQDITERIYKAHPMVWHHEGGGCLMAHAKTLLGVEVANFEVTCIYWPRWYKAKT